MKTRRVPSPDASHETSSGLRPFAAVCAMAVAAFVTIACSSRAVTQAPLPAIPVQAPAAWPIAGSDPSLPSAAQALRGRVSAEVEPAPTF